MSLDWAMTDLRQQKADDDDRKDNGSGEVGGEGRWTTEIGAQATVTSPTMTVGQRTLGSGDWALPFQRKAWVHGHEPVLRSL